MPLVEPLTTRSPPAANLRRRFFGKAGFYIAELALGTWGLCGDAYGAVTAPDAEATIERALELGVDTFDTSDAYGKGAMEDLLGRLLEPRAESTYVITKHGTDRTSTPPVKRFEPSYLATAFERSQERLRRKCIDVYLLHNPTVQAVSNPEVIDFAKELKRNGKVRTWGVSAGNTEVARAALQAGAEVISFAYNILIGSDFHSLASELAQHHAGVLAHSVLSYGLLAGLWHSTKEFPEGDHRRDRWTSAEMSTRIRQLDAIRFLLGGDVLTLRAAAVRFALANPLVSAAIVGPRNGAQLEQLMREAGNGPPYLDEDKLARLPSRLRNVGVGS